MSGPPAGLAIVSASWHLKRCKSDSDRHLGAALAVLHYDVSESATTGNGLTGLFLFWGEVKVPETLRRWESTIKCVNEISESRLGAAL